MSLDEIRHIHKKTPVQVNYAIKNKKCKQTARGNQNFYWDGGEKYPRKSSISACLGGFEKQRWTHGGKNGAGKDPEKGTQREFSRGPPEQSPLNCTWWKDCPYSPLSCLHLLEELDERRSEEMLPSSPFLCVWQRQRETACALTNVCILLQGLMPAVHLNSPFRKVFQSILEYRTSFWSAPFFHMKIKSWYLITGS